MDTTKETRFATPGENIVDPNKVNEIDYEGKKRKQGLKKVKKSITDSLNNTIPDREKLHDKFQLETEKSLFEMILSGEVTPTFKAINFNTRKGIAELEKVAKKQKENTERAQVNWSKLNEFRITI